MDSLKNLSANIPDWVRRLEELSGQIEQRQIELAKFAEANSPSPAGDSRSIHSIKSLRNKGSTESLRPNDEPANQDPTPENEDAGITPTPSPGPAASDVTPRPTPAPAAVNLTADTEATAAARNETQATPSPPAAAEPPTTTTTITATTTATAALLSPQPLSNGASSQQKQASDTELIEATRARARALVRKRIRSDSIVSAEGATVAYRSKNMVLVYYDSYVQSFFEELVKFVSGSRNMMRKAKMAAKVAHIKRMAELEMNGYSDDEDGELKVDDGPMLAADPAPLPVATTPLAATALEPAVQKREGDGDGDEEELPPLKYVSTRQMYAKSRLGPGGAAMLRPSFARASARGPYGGGGGISVGGPGAAAMSGAPVPSAFETLDKGLEFVQSTCERAAHQFLRDGDCEDEIVKIKSRLAQTRELAAAELERKLREGPSAEDLAAQEVASKGRSYRLPSMRREAVKKPAAPALGAASTPPRSPPSAGAEPGPPALTLAPTPALAAPLDQGASLEVDDSVEDDDYEVMPKLVYKSTRRMMRGDVY